MGKKGHKKCKFIDGCVLIASFGYKDGTGTQFCSKHKNSDMINLLCKLCECGRSRPTYNKEGLSANYCAECKTDEMINVNDKKCNCGKSKPSFNLTGLKAGYCAQCKTPEMINVVDNYCKCEKHVKATFNYPGIKPEYCGKCKLDGMIRVYAKKCHCGRVDANSNYPGLSPEYCGKCKLDGMILTHQRMCIQCNANQATYNLKGLKPRYCSSCRDDTMINVVDKCKNVDCESSGNIKYRYYCSFCFQHLFPDDVLTKNIRFKTSETCVKMFINEKFSNFIHDTCIWTGNCDCSHRRRIDHRILIGNTLLCIETDEFQHKKYKDKDNYEEIRYNDLYMIHGGKFIFIRFNPDKFVDEKGVRQVIEMDEKLEVLEKEIRKQMNRIKNNKNDELLEIIYLFFDA